MLELTPGQMRVLAHRWVSRFSMLNPLMCDAIFGQKAAVIRKLHAFKFPRGIGLRGYHETPSFLFPDGKPAYHFVSILPIEEHAMFCYQLCQLYYELAWLVVGINPEYTEPMLAMHGMKVKLYEIHKTIVDDLRSALATGTFQPHEEERALQTSRWRGDALLP